MSTHQTVLFFVLSCIQYMDFLSQFHNLEKHVFHKRKCLCWSTVGFFQPMFITTGTQYYYRFLYFNGTLSVYKMSNLKNLRATRNGGDYIYILIPCQHARKRKRGGNTHSCMKKTLSRSKEVKKDWETQSCETIIKIKPWNSPSSTFLGWKIIARIDTIILSSAQIV